jgi:hypothetical protein
MGYRAGLTSPGGSIDFPLDVLFCRWSRGHAGTCCRRTNGHAKPRTGRCADRSSGEVSSGLTDVPLAGVVILSVRRPT